MNDPERAERDGAAFGEKPPVEVDRTGGRPTDRRPARAAVDGCRSL
jgi:hypothetical protein